MSRYDWLLALHVLSAFAFLAAYTMLSAILVIGRRTTSVSGALAPLRIARPAAG